MSLVFERIQTEGIAELSYLLGDDSDRVAAVFDPTPDVDKYVQLAREKKVAITHIFETGGGCPKGLMPAHDHRILERLPVP